MRNAFTGRAALNYLTFCQKNDKRLAQLDLLCYDGANIRLTDKGFPLLDEIILELVS